MYLFADLSLVWVVKSLISAVGTPARPIADVPPLLSARTVHPGMICCISMRISLTKADAAARSFFSSRRY